MKRKRIIFKDLTPEVVEKAAKIIDSKSYISFSGYKSIFLIAIRLRDDFPDDRDFLFKHFGGYSNEQIIEGRTFYWINFQQKRAYMVLNEIYAHLDEQFDLVDMIFEFKKLIKKNRFRRLTDEVKAERQILMDKIKAFNKARYTHLKNNSSVLPDQDTTRTLGESSIDL